MAGKIGRSGRRSLSVEVERAKIRDLAWQRSGELMSDESVLKYGLPKVVAISATPIVRADMTKPVIIDQSQHTHITSVQVENMKPEELVELVMGRHSGRQDIKQPT